MEKNILNIRARKIWRGYLSTWNKFWLLIGCWTIQSLFDWLGYSIMIHSPIREISAWEHSYQITGEINTYGQATLRRSPFERTLYIDHFCYRNEITFVRGVWYFVRVLHHSDHSHGYVDLQPVDDHVRDADHYGEQIPHVSHCIVARNI